MLHLLDTHSSFSGVFGNGTKDEAAFKIFFFMCVGKCSYKRTCLLWSAHVCFSV
jgi:hypothetical protein